MRRFFSNYFAKADQFFCIFGCFILITGVNGVIQSLDACFGALSQC